MTANAGSFKKGNKAKVGKTKTIRQKEIRALCKDLLHESVLEIFTQKQSEVEKLLQSKETTRWKYLVAKAISKGDYKFVGFLIEAVVGRPTALDEVQDKGAKKIELKYKL